MIDEMTDSLLFNQLKESVQFKRLSNWNYHTPIKNYQATQKSFIDPKSYGWFTLSSENKNMPQ